MAFKREVSSAFFETLARVGPMPGFLWLDALVIFLIYFYFVQKYRYRNIHAIAKKFGFNGYYRSYSQMTLEQAQEVVVNMATQDFPWLFEFGWLAQFIKTVNAPVVSELLDRSGHFNSKDPMVAHRRQQDTVCLMTGLMVQPFGSEIHSLAVARINEHHNQYGKSLNSDTTLYLVWMWTMGPIDVINMFGWRKLEDFEKEALWRLWRELAVRLGCKHVPVTLDEMIIWKDRFAAQEVHPHPLNTKCGDSMLDMMLYKVPALLKPLGRVALISMLDSEVVWANMWMSEFSPWMRYILFVCLKGYYGTFQRHFVLPRIWARQLSPTKPNSAGLWNFPNYTYPSSPFYNRATLWNSWGPFALIDRLRGLPIPGLKYDSQGTRWEAMGAKYGQQQSRLERRIREQAEILQKAKPGYRAAVKFQPLPLIKPFDAGYGTPEHAYPLDCGTMDSGFSVSAKSKAGLGDATFLVNGAKVDVVGVKDIKA